MKHTLKISVSKKPRADSIINFRSVSVREKFLRLLFGMPCKITILVPGDSVEELSIHEFKAGHDAARHCSPMQQGKEASVG